MTEYFEATLQLRNIRQEILDFVRKETREKNIKIAKTEKHKNGIDLFLPSQNFAANLSKKLAEKFGGKVTISTRLFGKSRTGETLYRATVLYVASDCQPGDIVEINDKIVAVKSVGKLVSGFDLVARKNVKILCKGCKIKKLEKLKTQLTKHYPQLEVMHPETYESVAVLNPKEIKKKEVSVVITDKGAYLAE